MIQGCLFDMDGVLLDTEVLGMELLPQISRGYGYEFSSELYLKILGVNHELSQIILEAELGSAFPREQVMTDFYETFLARAEAGTLPLKPGLSTCIQGLKARGIRMALATSTQRELVERYLQGIPELRDVFDAVVCGSDVAKSKPEPDIYLLAAKRLGLSPGQCIGVEDSRNGLKSLTAANIPSVMIPDLLPYDESLADFVTWRLTSLWELCPLVDSLEEEAGKEGIGERLSGG